LLSGGISYESKKNNEISDNFSDNILGKFFRHAIPLRGYTTTPDLGVDVVTCGIP